jgi:hypothetical protein
MEHALPSLSLPERFLKRLDLRNRIMRLPLPVQLFINFLLAQALAFTIAVPDLIPLVDEVVTGWLFYVGVTATAASIRERYGDRIDAWRQRRVETRAVGALPDVEAELEELDPSLLEMTLQEIEGMDPDLVRQTFTEAIRRRS